jgi:hypothetical protein
VGLSDVTGVLSRYFVVGFFLPAYISLVALWLSASQGFLPNTLERHAEGTQLVILGAVGLIAALLLSGLSHPITRLLEGYPLIALRGRAGLKLLPRLAIRLQRRSFDRLLRCRDDPGRAPADRARAAWRLDQWFPGDPEKLLPTRFGNAMRAFEQHSNRRWGLDGVTIWPRIEVLIGSDERERHVDARIDLYVFVNAAVGAGVVGSCLVVDMAVNAPVSATLWWLYVIPFVFAYVLYRAAIGPAVRWGDAVRASIDMHRLELYEKLGVRAPTSFSDERELAVRINKALLYGHPLLPDNLWRPATDSSSSEGGGG